MEILRRITVWLAKAGYQLALFGWIVVTILVILLGSPKLIKESLASSGVFDSLPKMVLSQARNTTEAGDIPLDEATISAVIKSSFSTEQLTTYTNTIVDGFYSWLDGKTPEPNFKIDLTSTRPVVAEGVANQAAARLATLPTCTSFPTGKIDPFTVSCVPPGVNIASEKQKYLEQVLASPEFLPQTTFTVADLPKNGDGQTFAEQNQELPGYFQLAKRLPWILGAVAAVCMGIFLWLALDKRRALRSLGRMTLATGSFVLIPTLLFGLLLPNIFAGLQAQIVGVTNADVANRVIKDLVVEISKVTLLVSGAIVALGIAMLLVERFVNPPKEEDLPADAAEGADRIIAEQQAAEQKTDSKKDDTV